MLVCLMKLEIMLCVGSLICVIAGFEHVNGSSSSSQDVHHLKNETNSFTARSGKERQLYKELVDKLFRNHSPIIPPNADDTNKPVNLSILMVVQNIFYLDMKSQTLNIIGWFQIDWYDPAFSWDTTIYPIDMIVVNEQNVWRPVLAIANTLLPRDQIMQLELPISIFSNGNFRWFPGDSFTMHCHVNLNFYPFDVQTCKVELTQWSHHSHHFNCAQAEIRSEVNGNGEWDITDVGYRYYLNHEPEYSYWVLKYSITLKRKWMFYAINLIFPIIMVSALNSVVFMLPVDSGDKMSVSVTTFLTLVVFLTMIQDSLAKNSDTVCYLTLYLAVQMTLGALAIVQSAIVVACRHRTASGEDGHPKRSSKRKPTYPVESRIEDELSDCHVLNEENHSVKADGWGQRHHHQDLPFLASDNHTQSEQISDRGAKEMSFTRRSQKRQSDVRGADDINHRPSARDWTGLAAKIDSVCFPVFVGLNVMSLFVFFVIILSA